MDSTSVVTHDEAHHRFEVERDGSVATLGYQLLDDTMLITHTRVPPAIGGRGIGAHLVAAAVEHAEQQGLSVRTTCWFADEWLDRHPEEAARVHAR
jgi:predicted GNAT family acetyltransferase